MIGTHNSATGEEGKGLLSWLLTPFCRCQSKMLFEQWYAGCRYFDLRVKHENGYTRTVFAHGLWTSKRDVSDALYELNMLAYGMKDKTYISITYEGTMDDGTQKYWLNAIECMMKRNPNLTLASVNVKKPEWKCLWKLDGGPDIVQGFKSLDGSSWHTYIPLPWLWDKVFGKLKKEKMEKIKDSESTAVLVDFI